MNLQVHKVSQKTCEGLDETRVQTAATEARGHSTSSGIKAVHLSPIVVAFGGHTRQRVSVGREMGPSEAQGSVTYQNQDMNPSAKVHITRDEFSAADEPQGCTYRLS